MEARPTRQAVAWTEETVPVQLSPEEVEAVQERIKAMDALLRPTKRAKYKIEVLFTQARSIHKPTPGVISFWESGSKLHGGGDAKLYVCPGKSLKKSNCESFIPDSANASAFLWCPSCGQRWEGSSVIGEQLAVLSMKKWAEVILYYFVRLGHDADIYLKHAKDDIRTAAMHEQARQRGGELFAKVRDRRAKYIYPLRNLITDTSNGADLFGRFYAFLTA